jgi:2-keto-4-pentenoate hydratase
VTPDERVARGMRAQLALRGARLAAGERPIGWKLGFGAPAALERMAIDGPLVGFLTDAGLASDGAEVPVGDWTTPWFEAEIAVHLGAGVPAGADRGTITGAIAGLGAAIALADVDRPPAEDPEPVLAGNIFHRHVILGPVDRERRSAGGVRGATRRNGERVAETGEPEALTGELVAIVGHAAATLEAHGEALRAGDVVIAGAVVPPLAVASGDELEADLGVLGTLRVRLV